MDSYLKWFYETAVLLRELLSEKGSIYVHLDWHVAHYAKAVMDEVFSANNFRNEIIWTMYGIGKKSGLSKYPVDTQEILFYSKNNSYTYNPQTTEIKLTKGWDKKKGVEKLPAGYSRDEEGRVFWTSPKGDYTNESIEKLRKQGRIYITKNGTVRIKYFVREEGDFLFDTRVASNSWMDIADTLRQGDEQLGYSTQKPEALLARIIKASSNPGDLVLDCFCGSGTTAAVAEKLGRRWITCDLGRFAIHTARKRLLAIPNVAPFVVQNLGKYERQHWQIAEFGDAQTAASREGAYRAFILDLYRARPLSGPIYLHGVKGDRRVFVGGVDSPVSLGDLKNISTELKKTMGAGTPDAPTSLSVDILGWDFAFDLNETGKAAMQNAGINAKFIRIPREVLEKKAVEQGDIKFFELAALEADVTVVGKTVTVTLSDFVMPADDVPRDVQTAITHWSQWIDYWAVDWDNKNDTFHNQWQDYRTRKKRDLQYRITHTYPAPGTFQIVIKVIDILGNDTTKTVDVVIL